MDELQLKRNEIDNIDQELIRLLGQRFKVVEDIGRLKQEQNLPNLDPKRWNHVLEKVKTAAASNDLDLSFIEEIYELIHRYALEREKP